MAWYERVAGDPASSLERLAEGQDLTVAQLHERHRRIANVLGGEGAQAHLTARDWRQFRKSPDKLSGPLKAHLDSCDLCQCLERRLRS